MSASRSPSAQSSRRHRNSIEVIGKQSADVEAAIAKASTPSSSIRATAVRSQEAIGAKIPIVTIDRRARVPGILAHVSADNVKGGEAQGKLVMEPFPNGAKGKPVRLPMTESALAGMKSPPDVIVCANDDMALGALVALKSGNLIGKGGADRF